MSNFLSNPNIRRGVAALTMAGTMYAGAVACSSGESSTPTTLNPGSKTGEPCDEHVFVCDPNAKPSKKPGKPTSVVESTTSTTLSPEAKRLQEKTAQEKAAKEYVLGKERNDRINVDVQSAGQRFIQACATGEVGPCDIYNPQSNNQWRSSGQPTTAGWTILQHNPQYGDSPKYGSRDMQFSATVWTDENWKIDASKGVMGIHVADPNGSYSFEAPGSDVATGSKYDLHPTTWQVTTFSPDKQIATNSESSAHLSDRTLADVQTVDYTALSLLNNFRQLYNLQ